MEWRQTIYSDKYEVNNQGGVRRKENQRLLKGGLTRFGYVEVALYNEPNVFKHFKVHRLVALAFLPNPRNLPEVNHINGIKTDNRLENLEWVTHRENSNHASRTGLLRSNEKHWQAKLSNNDVLEIRRLLRDGVTRSVLSKRFGVTKSHITYIKQNKTRIILTATESVPQLMNA